MKYIIGIIIGGLLGYIAFVKYKAVKTASTTIPNTIQGFYAALDAGTIKMIASDPTGIYAADGTTKIGYTTADGSVYDAQGNLIAKGMGGTTTTTTTKLNF